jgi:hypothetical protein
MDFSNGGTFGTLSVRRRDEGCLNPISSGITCSNNYDLIETLSNTPNGGGCTSDNAICGFNNLGAVATGGWTSFDAKDNAITSLPTNQFTEFGIDVTALGLGAPCLATVEFKTRSSQSFTASLKDFALHSFQACTVTARTEIHSGNTPSSPTIDYGATDLDGNTAVAFNTTLHDQTIVTGQLGVSTPTGTVTFSRYSTANCTGTPVTETVTVTQVAAPTNTTPGIAAADSSAVTPAPGTSVSWHASFTPAANSPYTGTVDATPTCEFATISQLASQIITQVQQNGHDVTNTAITNGQPISDVATVSVSPMSITGAPVPTGTVTWSVYNNATCTGTVATTLSSSTPTSSSSGTATFSVSYTPTPASGVFVCFLAQYSGNTAYQQSPLSKEPEPICAFPFSTEGTLK